MVIAFIIFIPNIAYHPHKAYICSCKSNLESIARAIDMYKNDYKCLPHDKYPASENGCLVKDGYIGKALTDPLTNSDFIVIYYNKNEKYKIICPNPEKYYYSPKNTLKELYYDSEKGIVTDPPGK